MNNETKNEVKKNVTIGASTVAGATAGIVIGAAVSPSSAEAAEVVTPESTPQSTPASRPTTQPVQEPETQGPQNPETPETPQPPKQEPPTGVEPEVEVVGYDRVTNEDGSQMDIAVLNVNGNEVGVIDADLDGEADALVCDINQNGVIEDGEIEIVQGQGIAMQPFQDAAGFNPQYAQNDLPDYVNDADVDTYMA